jgi:hypothetical protein
MADIATVEIEVAVAVSGGGHVAACPYCQYHVQVNKRYLAWRDEMRANGCAISIIRAHVPVPEPLVTPASVRDA